MEVVRRKAQRASRKALSFARHPFLSFRWRSRRSSGKVRDSQQCGGAASVALVRQEKQSSKCSPGCWSTNHLVFTAPACQELPLLFPSALRSPLVPVPDRLLI